MFRSTTIRLTGWYLLILMSLSIIFSVIIYQLASNEIHTRLEGIQTSLHESQSIDPLLPDTTIILADQAEQTEANLFIGLFYVNLMILAVGGFGSYFLARRSLVPNPKAPETTSPLSSGARQQPCPPIGFYQ